MIGYHTRNFCDNVSGIVWTVRIVQFGQRHGRNDCLVHDNQEPLVEFYDTRYEHTDCGQFASGYYLKTLLDSESDTGLCLNGGVPEWNVSAACMQRVTAWLEGNQDVFRAPPRGHLFAVSVGRMQESHRVTYLVTLDRTDLRSENMDFTDSTGRITPFQTEILDNANFEASEWAEFLGTSFTPYVDTKAIATG